MRTRLDLRDTTTVGFDDGILNLSRLGFRTSDQLKVTFNAEVSALEEALRRDVVANVTQRAAIPLTWESEGLLVTLTIAGDADKVATVLQQLQTVVDPTRPPSYWIEPLSELIKATAPPQRSNVNWCGVRRGVLSIERSGVVRQQMLLPDPLMRLLLSTGAVTQEERDENHAPGI
jgi:hypothetical protein